MRAQSKPKMVRLTPVTTSLTDVAVLDWDFAPFAEQVSLQDSAEVPVIEYNGLSIMGAQSSDGKDYLYSGGARFNGAGTPGVRRCIIYTPAADGRLTVTFHSNSTSTRRLHIADNELHDLATAEASTAEASAVAELLGGNTYHIWVDNGGGGTISHLTYEL